MELFNPDLLLQKLQQDAAVHVDPDKVYLLEVLKKTLLKKYVPPGHDQELDIMAKLDFLARNENTLDCVVVTGRNINVMQRAKDRLYDIFHSGEYQSNVLTLNACVNFGYAGPGSSRGTKFSDFVRKMFSSSLTYTSDLLYMHYVSSLSERWAQAEQFREKAHPSQKIDGSSLSSVPKDREKNRTICTEPSLNMFYQLGAKHVIEGLLSRFYRFDMATQPEINKVLACSASIDGFAATMDLKNASDSISLALVRELLPPDTVRVLELLRSPCTNVKIGKESVNQKLKIISTMGNGFTFPLMTLLFHVLLDCYLSEFGDQFTKYRDGVFGDDIILPSIHFTGFAGFLEELGFVVNISKSFSSGPFRESCGGDYYLGRDVRGIYIKDISTYETIYSAFNRLFDWSVKHDISLPCTLRFLLGIPGFRPVPLDESDDAGFRLPSSLLSSPKFDRNGAWYYRAHKPVKRSFGINDSFDNPSGALIGALGGYVRDNRINLRNVDRTAYNVIKMKTPSWDFNPNPYTSCKDLVTPWLDLLSS